MHLDLVAQCVDKGQWVVCKQVVKNHNQANHNGQLAWELKANGKGFFLVHPPSIPRAALVTVGSHWLEEEAPLVDCKERLPLAAVQRWTLPLELLIYHILLLHGNFSSSLTPFCTSLVVSWLAEHHNLPPLVCPLRNMCNAPMQSSYVQ